MFFFFLLTNAVVSAEPDVPWFGKDREQDGDDDDDNDDDNDDDSDDDNDEHDGEDSEDEYDGRVYIIDSHLDRCIWMCVDLIDQRRDSQG